MTQLEETVSETLHQKYTFPEEKFESLVDDDFRVLQPWFETWAHTPSVVDTEYCKATVAKFIQFHNLENPINKTVEANGQREAHHSFTEYLWSDNILPCIVAIHQYALLTNDESALKKSSATLVFLNSAMEILSDYANSMDQNFTGPITEIDQKTSLSSALADLMGETFDANPISHQFLSMMRIARIQARQCLWDNRDKPIDELVEPIQGMLFHDRIPQVLNEFAEAKNGMPIPEYFIDRLIDPEVRALVISLDYNSTFNKHESYTTADLQKIVNAKLKKMTIWFKKYFPEKEIFVVINTGRPSGYAWAVLESSLEPIGALRTIALAESGGAILKEPMHKGEAEATVENPIEWKQQLDEIQAYLTKIIPSQLRFENKLSMVSMEIAPKNGDGRSWLHSNKDGQPVTDLWLSEQLSLYLEQSYKDAQHDWINLLKEQDELPELEKKVLSRLTPSGPDGATGTNDDIPQELFLTVKALFDEKQIEVPERIETLRKKIEVLRSMRENLMVKFNQTVGFVDIMHQHQNKLSGLMLALRKKGYSPHEVAAIHTGDAKVDFMPDTHDAQGRVIHENLGADEVLLVCVRNSSADLIAHVAKRKDHGYHLARKSAAGVIDLFEGITRAIPYAFHKRKRI